MSWWGSAGWTQTPGQYSVYAGDSSALANLPLRGGFDMTTTPAARQVTVNAPSTMQPGKASNVSVTLTDSGNATLHAVRIRLQLPPGWTAVPTGQTVFGTVSPGQAPVATFRVTPPSDAPDATATVHATATTNDWQHEAGVTVTVG
jgi:endo-alpha-N-acetylgalactosaminidase